ncbi:AAA family ATPase [Bacillus sp. SM2101]|uniref:AAA family ATPase n=1 Tax=Bacillus sp. SM2101 TaxID=2805366 RepID=UPI001BDE951F|nr:AAA family ATPase [Bacillus sp. SM2101]
MKIIGIYIYGYGKLDHIDLQPLGDIQVFYGKNEAGKSTLHSFIHSMLFGFPTKQQSENRYKPRLGSNYGGRLVLETEKYGVVTVERLLRKGERAVTVTFSDGTKAGEEALQMIVQGMDKSNYQSIFSFNIHGLQNIHTMKTEDLGRYLFSSGAVGTDAILSAEQKLSKKIDEYFKPNGRKPLINEMLPQLAEQNKQLLQWQEKSNQYKNLMNRTTVIKEELQTIKVNKKRIEQETVIVKKLTELQPLFEKRALYRTQLDKLPTYHPFPADGLVRFEQLYAEKRAYEAQYDTLIAKRRDLVEVQQNEAVVESMLIAEEKVQEVKSNYSLFQAMLERQNELSVQIDQQQKELHFEFAKLPFDLDEAHILQIDAGILKKDQLSTLITVEEELAHDKRVLDERFNRAKEDLEESEQKIIEFEQQTLQDEQRDKYEKQIAQHSSLQVLQHEQEHLAKSYTRLTRKVDTIKFVEKKKKQQINLVSFLSILLLVGLVGGAIFTGKWIMLLGGIIFLFIPLLLRFNSPSEKILLNELEKEKAEIISAIDENRQQLLNLSNDHLSDLERMLAKDDHYSQLLEIEKLAVEQRGRTYEKIVKKYTDWERDKFAFSKKLHNLDLGFPIKEDVSAKQLYEILLIIEKIKELIIGKQLIAEKKQLLEHDMNEFDAKVAELADLFQIKKNDKDMSVTLYNIDKRLTKEKDKKRLLREKANSINSLDDELHEITAKKNHLHNDIVHLFQLAEVQDEEQFRLKEKAFKDSQQILERLAIVEAQILTQRGDELTNQLPRDVAPLPEQVEKYDNELKSIIMKEQSFIEELSELKVLLSQLEEGGTYAELLHKFESEKSQLQEEAKKWASYAIAKKILTNTIDHYRHVRLPNVLKNTTANMKLLTNGEYIEVLPPNENNSFLLKRKDGLFFQPNEVSQATTEQMYVALRLALAEQVGKGEKFPIIIDDSFVNFDRDRLAKSVELIRDIAKKHQVLFFTCHEYILDYFHENEIILLENKTERIGI